MAVAAFFALAAFAVAGSFGAEGAGRAVVIGAASIQWNAFVIAALLILRAFACADTQRAVATAAIVVVAAFGAIAALTTRAAEQVVAAVALGARAVGDHAGFAGFATACPEGDAFVVTAFLTPAARAAALAIDAPGALARAIGVGAAFLASAGAIELTAPQIQAAFEQLTRARVAFGDAKVRALAHRHAFVATAFLTLLARGIGKAGAVDACAVTWAFVVGAALAGSPAIIGEGAAILVTDTSGDTFASDAFAADRDAIGISAALRLLADPTRGAHLASGTILVGAALVRAIVLGRAEIAAALSLAAIGGRTANATLIADGRAAFIF